MRVDEVAPSELGVCRDFASPFFFPPRFFLAVSTARCGVSGGGREPLKVHAHNTAVSLM